MSITAVGGGKIKLLGRFEILDKLGEGRFGKVYKVRDKFTGKIYALKEGKDLTFSKNLLNEAQNIILLNHPHLVKLHHYFTSKRDGKIYLLYEFCNGGDLKQYVEQRGGKLPFGEAFKILLQIAEGLEYLHRHGYIHLDIKPENVLSSVENGKRIWKLGDFSLIKPRGFYGILDVKGTVGYIAPEVFRGEIHRSSDVYSLGCLLYYMLEGHHPFKGENPAEELAKNKKGIITPPPSLPKSFLPIFNKMVKINPFERYRTAGELLKELKAMG